MFIDFLTDMQRVLIRELVLADYHHTEKELEAAIESNVKLARLLAAKNQELRKKLRDLKNADG